MLGYNLLVLVCLLYVATLFVVAYGADKRAREGHEGAAWLRGPWVYTLSLSVYCTAWTFYGAVATPRAAGWSSSPSIWGGRP